MVEHNVAAGVGFVVGLFVCLAVGLAGALLGAGTGGGGVVVSGVFLWVSLPLGLGVCVGVYEIVQRLMRP